MHPSAAYRQNMFSALPESHSWAAHGLYVLVLLAWAVSVPPILWDPTSRDFIFILGFLALWRYSWAGVNWTRFFLYTRSRFPAMRATAHAMGEEALPEHIYVMITSFRIGTETTRKVYDSVMREAKHYATTYNRRVTLVASIVERADETLIKTLFHHYALPDNVTLRLVRIRGTGKRDALAYGFRSIAACAPRPNDVVAVVDGDSLLEHDLLARTACFFRSIPELGGLTTDETCEVEGAWIFKEWYNLRFAQRNIYMSSVSLSRKVMTLTGRMSMFRASIITDPEFIARVEMDYIDHWRLGRFKFLTGDDKSTWFHMMEQGWQMIYVPDVVVDTIETPPDPSFWRSSYMLMKRWSGYMLRNNARGLRLGPRHCGWFAWLTILDQRVSMWTSLTSPAFALITALFVSPVIASYYLLWIFLSRYLLTLSLLASRPRVSAFYPFLLYFNQVVGSFIKTIAFFRLDQQKWTRQNLAIKHNRANREEWLMQMGSHAMHGVALLTLCIVVATLSGILDLPAFGL